MLTEVESNKQLLIIGGSRQIGRRLLEYLDEQDVTNWDVTVFNRGNHELPKVNYQLQQIVGDRETADIEQICQKDWDVVLDCIAYKPHSLSHLLAITKGRIKKYILISTISVYDLPKAEGGLVNELTPRKTYTDLEVNSPGMRFYGQCKAAVEDVLLECQHVEPLVLRPFFIVGAYDYNNLDHYWINRLKKYDTLLIPSGLHLIQRTYLEDLTRIIVHFLDAPFKHNTYLAVTEEAISIQNYLEITANLLKRSFSTVEKEESILLEHGIRPIFDLPYTLTSPRVTFDNSRLKSVLPFEFSSTLEIQANIIQHNNQGGQIAEGNAGISRLLEESIMNNPG